MVPVLPPVPDDLAQADRRTWEDLAERAADLADRVRDDDPGACPGCGQEDWVRDGRASRRHGLDVQMFRCRGCGRKRAAGADGPFRHPIFPPRVMVLALLLRREGWPLTRIAGAVGVATGEGKIRRPNRQTVGRWVKRYDGVLGHLLGAEDGDTAEEAEEAPSWRPIEEGDRLAARFEVLRTLAGRGGEGVFLASDGWRGEADPVVLKVLARSEGDRVRREFALRARLRHPHVAPVRDYGVLPDGRRWFSQTRVRGEDLFRAARGAPFERVLEWLVEVLRGCAYLHDRGVLHRDLKPDNILVGPDGRPRIVDFGISILRDEASEQAPSGSVAYLPPEVLGGSPPSTDADLYAIGRTFHHVLARALAPAGEPPPPLSERRSDVPPWFDEVVARLCDPRRGRRFPTATAVIEALGAGSGIPFATETRDTVLARVAGAPLVGRDEALPAVSSALASGTRGVLVEGPGGIGKTRLVEAWRQARQLDGGEVIPGGLAPLLRAVVLRLGSGHPLLRRHEDVVRRLTGEGGARPVPVRPREGMLRDRDALLDLLAAARLQGAVVVVDRLEEADAPTLALVDLLLVGDVAGPAVVMAGRPAGASLERRVRRWVERGRLACVTLEPLSEPEIAALLSSVFADDDLAGQVAPRLHAATEGHPRFVEEVLRGLVERGAVTRGADGGWRLSAEGPLPVPPQLVDACRARLEALDSADRDLLLHLAVAPGPVPAAAVAGLEGGDRVEAMASRELVRTVSAEAGTSWALVHEGVREAALLGSDEDRHATICRTVADAVEAATPAAEDRPAELLADLLVGAGEPERAVPHLRRAARRARERFDVDRALSRLEQLDGLLGSEDGGSGPDRAGQELRAEVLRELERVLRYRGRHEEQSVCLDRLTLLAQASGRADWMAEAAGLKALYWFDRKRPDMAARLCGAQLPEARRVGDRRGVARLLWVLAMAERVQGHPERGLELGAEALEALRDDGDPEAVELRVQLRINEGNAHAQRLHLDRAARAFERGLAVARREALWSSAIVCTMNLGICHAMQGGYGRALDLFDRARSQARRLGWEELARTLRANQAEVERNLGLAAAAAERLEPLVAELGPGRADGMATDARCLLALCRLDLGDRTGASALVETARRALRAADRPAPARLGRTEAAVLLADDTRETRARAEAVLRRVAEGGGPPSEVALAASRLARLALDDGRLDDAEAWSERACDALDDRPGRPREGRVEALHVRARVLLARERRDEAQAALRQAVDEVEHQAADLDDRTREIFLGTPGNEALLEEAGRRLGGVPGALAGGSVDAETRARDLRDVVHVARTLARAGGLGAVTEVTLDAALRHGGLERAHLLVREGERFAVLGGRRAGRAPLDGEASEPEPDFLERMARSGATAVQADSARVRWAVPLHHGERVVGAIHLDGPAPAPSLDDHRRVLLEGLADQAALAVQHQLQVDELERLRRRAEADLTRTRARLQQEASRRARAERVVEAERRTIRLRHRYDRIVHGSRAMRELLSQVDRLVDSDVSVLITGESGTGKELVARALHHNGPRSSGPFVALNCGAIPPNLVESELFGHVRGAFTGAHRDRRGHFALADGGTLLLDEIGEIAPDVQIRLLRVLETGEVMPVGGTKRVPVDVRIVAATNRDLREEVAEGRFREDLYYRIQTVTLGLPPLRERPEDIPLLVEHFARQVVEERGGERARFGPAVMERLKGHAWPGNVRELRNVVEYATLFAEGGEVPADLSLPF
ncbi:MAG: sigma 54-interacting transcriptional regulator [Myxococcota bacterium]